MTSEDKPGEAADKTSRRGGTAQWRDDMRVAIAFLTRFPVGRIDHGRGLAKAAWAFPVAGVVVGAVGAAAYHAGDYLGLPPLVTAMLAVAATVLATGALHEDGLADVADGFGGGAAKARKLEIMRDSRIGSYGVLALIFGVGLRVAALAAFASASIAAAALFAAAVMSRASLPALMKALPPAREDGLGHDAGRPNAQAAGIALALGSGIVLFALQPHLTGSVILAAAAFGGAALIGAVAKRQVGGQTGDVLGAAQQVSESAALIAAAAVLS